MASFLDCAKKLEIKGLEGVNHVRTLLDEQKTSADEDYLYEESEAQEQKVKLESYTPNLSGIQNYGGHIKDPVFYSGSMTKEEVALKRKKLYQKVDGSWFCKACDYITTDASNIIKHSETHMKGLLFTCKFCNKECRSRSNLYSHVRNFKCIKFKNNKN